jgi:hypothetical protein
MQLVFEFGSRQLGAAVEAIRRVLGELAYEIRCVPKGSDRYEPTADSLDSAAKKIEAAAISAFSLHPKRGMIRYALILSPSFEEVPCSLYVGTIEYTGEDYAWIWDLLLETPGLTVVCLGFEEGVEFEDSQLTVDNFPWGNWPLVIGALREESGTWVIREGPEMKWFQHRI